ncbi:MAG: hypothetical protein AAF585_05670 [Verrucomicrobiota bacterium]
MKTLVMVLVGLGLTVSLSYAGPREFTSNDGKKLLATIQSITGESVRLKRLDGQSFSVPFSRFSTEDQAYFKQWKEENKGKVPEHLKDKKPRLLMQVSTGARSSKESDRLSGYVDEKKKKIQLTATLENQDQVYPIDKPSLTLLVWGRSPETGNDTIVHKQVFKEIDLPLAESKKFQGVSMEVWYDDEGAMYGHQYKGYFAFLTAQDGKVLAEKTIPSSAAKHIDMIKKLTAGDVFGRGYRKEGIENVSKTIRTRG